MSRVAVVFTGGTIAMTHDPVAGGAVPALDGAAILRRTRGLDEIADVRSVDWGLVPASHLRFSQILDLARTVQEVLDEPGVDGAVVVQGTDTIEETSFALDLLLSANATVAVTGAMRRSDEDGYDGPANLRDAVRCAASAELRDAAAGVVVVMDGRILPADDATKTHTDAYGTFRALNDGAIGSVGADGVRVTRRRVRRRRLERLPDAAAEPVVLVTAVVGDDGLLVRCARDAGARGIVVAATGAGNTSPALIDAATDAIGGGIPVALTTRCPSGRARPAYGFPGGGAHWIAAGAMPSGTLGGPKARVALALGIGAGLDGTRLRELLAG